MLIGLGLSKFAFLCLISGSNIYFSIKVHHSGDFNISSTEHVGGKVDYFDMCSNVNMSKLEYDAMLGEVGLKVGEYDLWLLIPGTQLPDGLFPINTDEDAGHIDVLVEYSKLQCLYTTPKITGGEEDWFDFSLSQYEMEEKEKRMLEMTEEIAEKKVQKPKKKGRRIPPLRKSCLH